MLTDPALFAEAALPYAVGAVLTFFGFVIRRWWTKERERERVNNFANLAQIASLLKTGQLTAADVTSVEQMLKRTASLVDLKPERVPNHDTQAEMNEYAAREVQKLDLELDKVLLDLNAECDDEELKLLAESQAQWKKFRELHAEFVTKMFEGGSMRPLMYFTSIDTATRVRIEELQNYLESRQGI